MIPHTHRRTFGSGARSILTIHCSLAHSGAWRGMGAALDDVATLHAFDLPNHGKSGNWDGQGVMHDTAAAMALSVLDDLGPAPVDIIGHSFGATVALRLAIEHPVQVRSLTLFEPVYFAPVMADDPEFTQSYLRDTAAYEAAMDAGDHAGAARAFHAAWGEATGWDQIPKATQSYMVDRIAFVRHSAPFLTGDSAGLLESGRFDAASMPVLLMRGAQSRWAKAVNGAIARRLPDVRDIEIAGVGHMAPIAQPGIVADHVRSFLSAL